MTKKHFIALAKMLRRNLQIFQTELEQWYETSNPKRLAAAQRRQESLKAEEYNGWPNYETWNVMLWMDNEEPAYRAYREKVQRYRERKWRFGGLAARAVCGACFGDETPDGVSFSNPRVRWGKIAEAMRET